MRTDLSRKQFVGGFSVTARECFGKTGRPIASAPFMVLDNGGKK